MGLTGAGFCDRDQKKAPLLVRLTQDIDTPKVRQVAIDAVLSMLAVTVSPKYQVVMPKEIRESMGIVSGQKIQMLTYRNRIELIPIKPMNKLKGLLKGIDTDIDRDDDRL